jgi:dTDP-4-dehydrorhamnose reductase
VNVLITGASGQLGQALTRTAPSGLQLTLKSRRDLDISNADEVLRAVDNAGAGLIVNAAAYTAVDRAETDQHQAQAVNVDGPRYLAAAAREHGARLIHLSTDFVFDGMSSEPYRTNAAVAPLSVYGRTKALGEAAISNAHSNHAIVRTSWVYSPWGANFVLTMLRLMRERGAVRVVSDQIGRPTSAISLARALWSLAERPELRGMFHWADAGVASWYDLAVAIAEEGAALGLLPSDVQVTPIATEEYATAARRPKFSVLDTGSTTSAIGVVPAHWRVELRNVLGAIAHA